MIELSPHQYPLTHALFVPLTPYHLAIESLLAGKSAGTILVDDPGQPHTALAWTSHRVFLGGHPLSSQEFARILTGLFANDQFPAEFGLYYPPAWETVIEVLGDDDFGKGSPLPVPPKQVFCGLRHYYAGRAHLRDGHLPEEFTLRPIDAPLLTETHLKNLFPLVDELKSERESVTTFLRNSFGFCALYGDEIAGWCTSEYNTGTRCEVGIATVEGYRRRGIATALASALIEHALANGYTEIGWHCWANNVGSVATARKLGLEKVAEYPVWAVVE